MSKSETSSEWTLRFSGRPVTTNAERRMHHFARAEFVRRWRADSAAKAKLKKVPPLTMIAVHSRPHLTGRLQDADACHPTIKAVIDGLVDAGVIPDDDPRFVRRIVYHAPVRSKADFLDVTIEEVLE